MDSITLAPELERFAAEAVASGRYRDMSAVVAAGRPALDRGVNSARHFAPQALRDVAPLSADLATAPDADPE